MKINRRKASLTAGVVLLAASIFLISKMGLWIQLKLAANFESNLWMDVLLPVCESRYGNDPEFQRAIGLIRFERSKQDWRSAFDMFDRVIESNADSDTKISPLLARAEMWRSLGKYEKALVDLEKVKPFVQAREARGITYMCSQSMGSIDRAIENTRKKLDAMKSEEGTSAVTK